MTSDHARFMQSALTLARRNLGQTWPNPAVGALVVKNGQIIGAGYTARGGRPHAETEALAQAGENAKGATMYVTLEPCSHHGKTPPCTDAIIGSGIKKIIVACGDSNPAVNGGGIKALKEAGIEVIENICANEARELNRGFISIVERKRPHVALKIATSQDDKITTGTEYRWLTSEKARCYGHILRSQFDAIATGIGTVLADDPELTCRLPGMEDRSPLRVLFDSEGKIPENSKLIKTAKDVPLWIMSSRRRPGSTSFPHVQYLDVDPGLRRDDELKNALELLAKKGITRLLIEAGQKLSTAFLQRGLVDRIYWFRAPIVVGEKGLAALTEPLAPSWKKTKQINLQPDTLEIFECSPAS